MERFDQILNLRSISEKNDFIDAFNFSDNVINKEFLISFIKREIFVNRNEWYKTRLIDLTTELEITDDNLISTYLQYIKTGSFYLKLTILDYINNMYSYYNKDQIDATSIEALLSNKYERLIVKIQATLTLIFLLPLKKIYYINMIKKLLHRSNDYRAHIRLYNFIMSDYVNIPVSYINDYIEITRKKEFSTSVAVTSTLNELNTFLSSDRHTPF